MLTGCRKGTVPRGAAHRGRADAAARELDRLARLFGGPSNVAVELTDHGDPTDGDRNDALAALAPPVRAADASPPTTCTTPRPSAAAAGDRARGGPGPAQSLDEIDPLAARRRRPPTCAAAPRWRSGSPRYPGAVAQRARIRARTWPSTSHLVAPKLPDYPVPAGHTEMDLACAS